MFEEGAGSQGPEAGIGRRAVLGQIAAAALVGPLELAPAQHVHESVAADTRTAGGVYKPKALTAHEFETLKSLCELIVPGASKGGAAEFVDTLATQNADLLTIYGGGIAWLDDAMRREFAADFLAATPEQKTSMLDRIAYRKNDRPELAPGIRFFVWARRLTVDAYYTSAAGIKEVGYLGNRAQAEFKVPQDALDYAVKRSGL